MKRIISLTIAIILSLSLSIGCTRENGDVTTKEPDPNNKQTLKVATLESAYGADMWKEICTAFENANNGVTVELTTDKNIEDVIGAQMKAGNYPDVVHLSVGREAGLTETLTKENGLTDLSDMLDMTVPGENIKVKDKIIEGFTSTLVTNPYSDGKTYLAPMFYGPCGLFYNTNLFKQKGWTVPKTWDEMWELGEKAKAEGIALFTYPTTGYFDAFFYALLNEVGGPEFFNKAMTYTDGIWESDEATKAFEIVGKLATYTEKTTVANANNDNFLKNQQLILDNKALFMPNGTWIVEEMKNAPRAEGFEWGFTALPALSAGGDSYSYTFFEQAWIPAEASNKDLAKKFLAFLYSDEAAGIFAKSGAIQPIKGISSSLTGDNKLFYSIYDTGAKAAMGVFATTNPVEGVSMADTLFGTVNSIVSGDKTVKDWQAAVEKVSDTLRANLK